MIACNWRRLLVLSNLKLSDTEARNVAAYLFLWSKQVELPKATAASRDEMQAVLNQLNASDAASAAKTLLKQKGCVACHSGLEKAAAPDIAIKNAEAGCMTGKSLPRFALSDSDRHALNAFVKIANLERQPSPFFERQRQLDRAGCVRCHQRDTDAPTAMETIGSTLGGAEPEAAARADRSAPGRR